MGWECAVCGSRLDDSSLICRICGYQKDTEKFLHLRCPTCQREYTFGIGMKPLFCDSCGADLTHVLSYAIEPEYQFTLCPLHLKNAKTLVLQKENTPYLLCHENLPLLSKETSLKILYQNNEWCVESQKGLYVNGRAENLSVKIPIGLTHLRVEDVVLRIALTEV